MYIYIWYIFEEKKMKKRDRQAIERANAFKKLDSFG